MVIVPCGGWNVDSLRNEQEGNAMKKNTNERRTLDVQRNLRAKEVILAVGLSRATIYRLMDKYQFPQKVKLSQGLVGWRVEQIKEFIELGPDGWYEKYGQYQEAANKDED